MKLSKISKSFKGNTDSSKQIVLDDFDLTIKPAEFISVTGPSGSGKSTLLNIIGLLDRPDSGSIISEETDLTKLSVKRRDLWRRDNLGFIFQFHHLLPELTALENVALVLQLSGFHKLSANEQAIAQLNELGLSESLNKFPSQLSGGEQQRVAVARAVIKRPKLILADEPTGNLDHDNAEIVFNMLRDSAIKHKISVLMVTHNKELAALTDREIALS